MGETRGYVWERGLGIEVKGSGWGDMGEGEILVEGYRGEGGICARS